MPSALDPSGAASFTLAPCFSSSSAVSRCALRTAKSSGVNPPVDLARDVRAGFEQHRGRVGVALRGRPHQRGLPAIRFDRVHLGAALQQQPHGVGASRECRRHQHRLAFVRRGVRVGARREQSLHDRGVAVQRREVQRRHVVARGRLGVGAGAHQQIHELRVVALGGPVQRRRAVGGLAVHVHSFGEQRAHGRDVLTLGGVDECGG